jgi:hypothetical protein
VQIDSIRGLAAFLVGVLPLGRAMSDPRGGLRVHRRRRGVPRAWTLAFVSNMLSMLMVAPLVLAWNRAGARRGDPRALAHARS